MRDAELQRFVVPHYLEAVRLVTIKRSMKTDDTPTNGHSSHSRPQVRPNLLRRMNERRLLEAVQSHGGLSRAELVRLTGISPPTVSKLVRSLLAARLLEEGDAPDAAVGRPAKVLRPAKQAARVLGAVIDIRECSIAATGLDGRLETDRTLHFGTPESYELLLEAVVEHAGRLMPRRDKAATLALGLTAPGLIDRQRQQVLFSANLHQLDGHYLARDLEERLGLRTILLHETDALCLGERGFGQARGMDDFALIDATGGLGAAVMSRGHVMTGHGGLAGEIGHITIDPSGRRCGCGNIGCLETVASDLALAGLIAEKIGQTVSIAKAFELVRSGDVRAYAEIDRTIEYLAIGVAAVVNIFNPAAVLVQARMFDLRQGGFDRLLELVQRRALSPVLAGCKIMRASGSKLQSAVAGIIHHLTTVLGPRV
jgi:predicted NBD/HSP70 family sugar kinase